MLLISVLLFWLPILGPIIAGFVGGKKIGSVGKSIIAALLPVIVLAALTIFIIPIVPALGFLSGFVMVLVGINSLFLLLGAIIGGAIGQ